jgi:cobalt-zinc-cadmium efflux system outer membrane protein
MERNRADAFRMMVPVIAAICLGQGVADPGIAAVPGELWLLALDGSNELAASGLAVESASSVLDASGRLPDPSLRIGWAPGPLETRNGPVDFTATLVQRIPWPGVLAGSREQAGYGLEISELQDMIAGLRMRTRITGIWAEMYIARAAIDLKEDELERLEYLSGIADVRYRAGQTGLRSLLTLENRMSMVRSELDGQEIMLDALGQELASAVGVETGPLEWPDSVPGLDYFRMGIADSVEIADTPAVLLSSARNGYGRAGAEMAGADMYPDLEIGLTWSSVGGPSAGAGAVEPGSDALMLFAGMSLPLGYSGSAERASSAALSSEALRYMQMQAVSDQAARRRGIVGRIESLLLLCDSYEMTVLPNLEAICDLATADWVSGGTGLDEVIDSIQELEEARLDERMAWSGIVTAYAELVELDGRDTGKGEFL